jgi:hypothetical protein
MLSKFRRYVDFNTNAATRRKADYWQSHSGVNLARAFADVVCSFKIEEKMLSVTCDNASNNDTMLEELDDLLSGFSSLNRTRCFAHILNLVAKALLKQFDVKSEENNDLNDDERSLLDIEANVEIEGLTTAQEDDEDDEIDDEEWVDGADALTPEERTNLEESIRPVKRTLVKVRSATRLAT